MEKTVLERLFEHNNWANQQIIQACSALTEGQLGAEPQSVTKGSIRNTLMHLVGSQRGYLALLTLPVDELPKDRPAYDELMESARLSGEGLIALVRDDPDKKLHSRLQTTDGYFVEPWVVLTQVINHATEHREQIKSMLSALGVPVPDIDGWDYGVANNTLVKMAE